MNTEHVIHKQTWPDYVLQQRSSKIHQTIAFVIQEGLLTTERKIKADRNVNAAAWLNKADPKSIERYAFKQTKCIQYVPYLKIYVSHSSPIDVAAWVRLMTRIYLHSEYFKTYLLWQPLRICMLTSNKYVLRYLYLYIL